MNKFLPKAKTITAHLDASEQTAHLNRMLAQQQALLKHIHQQLPPVLKPHCLHARISGKQLILHVDSSAWASKLRFLCPQLLQSLQPIAPHLATVKIRTYMPLREPQTAPAQRKLSKNSADVIHASAQSIVDPDLKAALERLSRVAGK